MRYYYLAAITTPNTDLRAASPLHGFTARFAYVSRCFADFSHMFRKFHTAYFTCFTHVSHCFASVSQVSRTLFRTCFASANYVVTSPERFSVAHSRELNRTAACSCGGKQVRAVTADSRDSHQIRECFASVSRVSHRLFRMFRKCFASVSQAFRVFRTCCFTCFA